MTIAEVIGKRRVPPRALILSLLALLVPVIAEFSLPPALLGANQAFLWLVGLIPAFLLAYYRGWRGAAMALAAGMVTLSITQAVSNYLGHPSLDIFTGVVISYVVLSLGVGWLADLLHGNRSDLEELALTDLLTNLPNRRHAQVFLENEFGAAERGRLLSIVLFDLDNFKLFNERFGHQAGDQALEAFAGILSATTRRMNLSSRFEGEQFLTILAGSDGEGSVVFAERVRAALRAIRLSEGSLTVSAGVATFDPSMRSPDELLAGADHALHEAKREGRNRVRLFGRDISEDAVTEAQMVEGSGDTEEWSPRVGAEVGRTRPPVTLPPHQVTGFGADRRILLVEDQEAVRNLLTSYLTKEGFGVTTAGDVGTAIQDLGSEFDVVITDLELPGLGRMELVSAAKARWPATQVVVITGVRDAQVAAEAMSAGADRYLLKPFGMPELRAELQDALTRRDRALMDRTGTSVVSAEAKGRWEEALGQTLNGIRSLVEAVEIKDPHVRGHHSTVTALSQEMLRTLDPEGIHLPPPSLSLGTQFMDVGKITVPDGILNKAGPLTPEEIGQLRNHPEVGRRILKSALDDQVALEVVTWHHERWDGGGYPNGLLAEAIPLSARIAAIADVLDALTNPRPYRAAFSWDEAVQTILTEEGHFGPQVLDAFEKALPRLKEIRFGESPHSTSPPETEDA